jgi:ubiquinone/menaquinone biosynthesis C-methylase UbiE
MASLARPIASPIQKDALKRLKKSGGRGDGGDGDDGDDGDDVDGDHVPAAAAAGNNSGEDDDVGDYLSSEDSGMEGTDYAAAAYWDKRYDSYSPFDWLMEYDHYKKNGLAAFIQPTDNIVMLGCGSAAFSADMYDDGFVHIKNIDLSSVVIDKMRAMHAEDRPEMTWQVMDVQKLEFDDETFDVAFDKSTMDCLFCCDGSNEIIAEMMREAWRVLKPGGLFISLSLHHAPKVVPFVEVDQDGHLFDWTDVETFPITNPRWEPGSEKSESYVCVVAIKPAVSSLGTRANRGVKKMEEPASFSAGTAAAAAAAEVEAGMGEGE